ncbi:hypothetical protein CWO89_33430, partial [Bradyrhizobium sp. Leo170]
MKSARPFQLSASAICKSGERAAAALRFLLGDERPIPEAAVTRRKLILILAATATVSALALSVAWAREVPKVTTGFVAGILCSEIFVSGLEPERILAETTAAMPGAGLISWALGYRVDRARRDVTVTLLGLGRSHAVYREGFGCYLDHGTRAAEFTLSPDSKQQPLLPDIAGPSTVAPQTPDLVVYH